VATFSYTGHSSPEFKLVFCIPNFTGNYTQNSSDSQILIPAIGCLIDRLKDRWNTTAMLSHPVIALQQTVAAWADSMIDALYQHISAIASVVRRDGTSLSSIKNCAAPELLI
jgi:hypothetical protein